MSAPETEKGAAAKDEVTAINQFFNSFRGDAPATNQQAFDGALRTNADGSRCSALLKPLFATSHACNILCLPDGTLHLVWFSGEEEGGAGIGILHAQLPAGATTWTLPKVVSVQPDRSAQNPVLFHHQGRLILLHTSQAAFAGQGTAEVRTLHSDDGGASWSQPAALFREAGAFTKNSLLPSLDGTEWLLPMYFTPDGFFQHHSQYSAIRRSADGGATWSAGAPIPGTVGKLVQPTVVRPNADAKLVCFFRSRDADCIYKSESLDDGHVWSPAQATPLPNNNSGIQAIVLASGCIALCFNHVKGKHARCPLSIALSQDHGETWPWSAKSLITTIDHSNPNFELDDTVRKPLQVRDLQPDAEDPSTAGARPISGEFSYPSLTQSADGYIHVAYTFRRETVQYVRITEEWIRRGGTVGPVDSRLQCTVL